MTDHRPRRPVWKPSALSRVLGYIKRALKQITVKQVLKQITLKRFLIVVLGPPALIYLVSEVFFRDNLIIPSEFLRVLTKVGSAVKW